MEFKVNNTKVKTFMYNNQQVKKFDVVKSGSRTTVYKSTAPENPQLLINGLEIDASVTGGFSVEKKGSNWYFTVGYYKPSNADGYIRMYPNTRGNTYAFWFSNSKIDVSGYSKLKMRIKANRKYGDNTAYSTNTMYIGGGLYSERGDAYSLDGVKAFINNITASLVEYTVEVDVSGVSGEYYVGAGYWHTTSSTGLGYAQLYDIQFEE